MTQVSFVVDNDSAGLQSTAQVLDLRCERNNLDPVVTMLIATESIMKTSMLHSLKAVSLILFAFLLTACAAGDAQFTTAEPAGFLFGIWHGVISVISLLIHVFNNDVAVYELNNTGGWYDLGFLLGVICIWGGGSHVSCKTAAEKKRDREWEEVGSKVEKKVMRKLKEWAEKDEASPGDDDWEVIGEKVEKKLKRQIREWAEKD